MPSPLVHQLMTCYWIDNEIEVETVQGRMNKMEEISNMIDEIMSRPKPNFDF